VSDAELAERAGWERPPPDVYRRLSAASQLFGSTLHAGLLSLDDATVPARVHERSHVAIDRFTGGVGEGPFTEELTTGAVPLETTLRVECFALWHLALLALTLRELDLGYAAIGGGTRKGQGRVKAEVLWVNARYAETVYRESGVSGGVISAQAWLHHATEGQPWYRDETPPAVLAAEGRRKDGRAPAVLLPDLTPQDESADDWRRAGTLKVSVPQKRVAELFRAAISDPWRAWLAVWNKEGETYG
jgi:hypothetical protein